MAHAKQAGQGATPDNAIPTPAIDTTGADLLVAVCDQYSQNLGLSDNKGNTWTLGVQAPAGNVSAFLFYCQGGTVGPGHTFRWQGDYGPICVLAFKGSAANVDAINSLWEDVSSGKITADEARQRALQFGGGFDKPAWFRGRWSSGLPEEQGNPGKSR